MTEQNLPTKENYFKALTGVRAIAAAMVFFHHFNPCKPKGFAFQFINEFHAGVALFFVLSGFLICYRYYDTVSLTRSWLYDYIKKRVARIYPMYLLLTLATFAVFTAEHVRDDNNLFVLFANVFFYRGFFNDLKFTGIAQGWTLTVEECFYLLAPLLFVCHKKMGKLFLQPIAFLVAGFLLVFIFSKTNWHGFMRGNHFMLCYTFFGRCLEFFVGIFLALQLKKRQWKTKPGGVEKKPLYTVAGLMLFAFSLLAMAYIAKITGSKSSLISYKGICMNNILLPIAIAVFFFGLITEKSLLRKILETGLFQLLGKSSYSFYLVHMGVIQQWVSGYLNTYGGNVYFLFIIMWMIAILLYRLIEEPLNNKIRSLTFKPATY